MPCRVRSPSCPTRKVPPLRAREDEGVGRSSRKQADPGRRVARSCLTPDPYLAFARARRAVPPARRGFAAGVSAQASVHPTRPCWGRKGPRRPLRRRRRGRGGRRDGSPLYPGATPGRGPVVAGRYRSSPAGSPSTKRSGSEAGAPATPLLRDRQRTAFGFAADGRRGIGKIPQVGTVEIGDEPSRSVRTPRSTAQRSGSPASVPGPSWTT